MIDAQFKLEQKNVKRMSFLGDIGLNFEVEKRHVILQNYEANQST